MITLLATRAVESAATRAGGGNAYALTICSSQDGSRRLGHDLLEAFARNEGAVITRSSSSSDVDAVSARLPAQTRSAQLSMVYEDSATTFEALAGGGCDLAISGAELDPVTAARFAVPPVADTIALDGAVLVVNPQNRLRRLRGDQIRGIFAGTVTRWSQIGAGRGAIRVVMGREHGDEMSPFIEHALSGRLFQIMPRRIGNVAAFVASAAGRDAVGLTSFHASEPAIIAVDPKDIASLLTIGRRTYDMTFPIYLYREESRVSPAAYRFIRFLSSNDGQRVVMAHGYASPFLF